MPHPRMETGPARLAARWLPGVTVGIGALLGLTRCGADLGAGADEMATPSGAYDGGAEADASPDRDANKTPDADPISIDGSSDAGLVDQYVEGRPTQLHVVHASPNLFEFRVCFEVDGAVLHEHPLPSDPNHPIPMANYPGVPVGGSVFFDSLKELLGANFLTVAPILVRATDVDVVESVPGGGAAYLCDDLVGSTPGTGRLAESDIVRLPPIQSNEVLQSPVELYVIHGCLAGQTDDPGSAPRCGTNWEETSGNIDARIVSMSPMAPTGDYLPTLQVAHLSPSLDAIAQANGAAGLSVRFGAIDNPNAGNVIADSTALWSVTLVEPNRFSLPATLAEYGTQGMTAEVEANETTVASASVSLGDIQAFSVPEPLPDAFFGATDAFVLLVLGDASGASTPVTVDGNANPAFDGKGLHFLVIPTGEPVDAS